MMPQFPFWGGIMRDPAISTRTATFLAGQMPAAD
jgi:hypothetical protein